MSDDDWPSQKKIDEWKNMILFTLTKEEISKAISIVLRHGSTYASDQSEIINLIFSFQGNPNYQTYKALYDKLPLEVQEELVREGLGLKPDILPDLDFMMYVN